MHQVNHFFVGKAVRVESSMSSSFLLVESYLAATVHLDKKQEDKRKAELDYLSPQAYWKWGVCMKFCVGKAVGKNIPHQSHNPTCWRFVEGPDTGTSQRDGPA